MWNLKQQIKLIENTLMVERGGFGVWAKWVQGIKGKTSRFKINHGDVMYSMGTTVSNTYCIRGSC